jgi:hypothetical protein
MEECTCSLQFVGNDLGSNVGVDSLEEGKWDVSRVV